MAEQERKTLADFPKAEEVAEFRHHDAKGMIVVGEIINPIQKKGIPYKLFFDGKLIIFNKEAPSLIHPQKVNNDQYEFPAEALRWFTTNIKRFFIKPGEPGALPSHLFHVPEDEVAGEWLMISRGFNYDLEGGGGYALVNLSRFSHDDLYCFAQEFKMIDPWLFKQGLLEYFEQLAAEYESGQWHTRLQAHLQNQKS